MVVFLILTFLTIIIFVFYVASKWKYNYWKNKKVPYPQPTPLLGNYGEYILMNKYMGSVVQKLCMAFPNEPYVGVYYGTEPTLIVMDPELIKFIMTKEFPYFNGREVCKYTEREIVTQNLFFTHSDRWKLVRQSMSPLFTSSKIKNMFYLVRNCAYMFEELLDYEVSKSQVLEVRDLMARYTMDCICSCGFGIEAKTLNKDVKGNHFKRMGDLIFAHSNIRGYAWVSRAIWPAIFYGVGLQVFPNAITNFFHKLLLGVFDSRQYKPSARNDFVDMVLNIRDNDYIECEKILPDNSGTDEKVRLKIDDDYLVAQCVVFFAAGFETSATATSFALYELAKNERAQDRLLDEIDEYLRRKDGKIDFGCNKELPYLEACIDEALRMYPPLGNLSREVMADCTLPSGLRLEKGLRIHIPVYHLHHNPDYFPEPNEYRPERFLPEAKASIKQYTYLPFGEGPRICIGMRIARMIMAPGLIAVLKKYRVTLADGMPRTLELDPRALVIQAKCDLRLKFTPREGWQQRVFRKE